MTDSVAFRGTLHHWTLGEPPRLELVCYPTDNAVAQSIALLKGREIRLAIFFKDERICTLAAALPPISTVVGKFGKSTKVKLDVYPDDMPSFLSAIRLADSDGTMRFEFAPGGSLPEKSKREAKTKEPTPYGRFWQAMDRAGFHNRPDVRAWLSYFGEIKSDDEAKQALRDQFQTSSRSNISPDELLAALKKFDLAEAMAFVEKVNQRNGA